jgi:hypothetical protein
MEVDETKSVPAGMIENSIATDALREIPQCEMDDVATGIPQLWNPSFRFFSP